MSIESEYPGFPGYRDVLRTIETPSAGTAFTDAHSSMGDPNGQESNEEPQAEIEPEHRPAADAAMQEPPPLIQRSGDGDGLPTRPGDGNGEAPTMRLPDDLNAKLDGFTRPASDCINKARRIARELNHTSVSAAHLVLALTLDPRSSRRLRDQGVDVDLVREGAVQFLAKYNCMYSAGTEPALGEPDAAPDLADILETATRFAQEREDEEEINISDLLDAFRKSGSRAKLIYEPQEPGEQTPAAIRRVEQWLVPQIDQVFSEMENRLLAHAEERINALVGEAGLQLGGQIASLKQATFQLTDVANALAQAKRQSDGGKWWGR